MKVHFKMIGCRLNQGEIDAMARSFARLGHEIVSTPEEADQVIVNTCAVTQDAERVSRQMIRQTHRANERAAITVTGCYAHLAPDAVRALTGVTTVIDNLNKDRLVEMIAGQPEAYDLEPIQRGAAAWMGRTRAFVKVQDGCDNACTFCITTVARGAGRSRPMAEVVDEIRALHMMGYQEAVLTGVHLGSTGHDRGERDGLARLVRTILAETDIPRLRLSSLEPWDLSPEFFDLWQNPRLCPHLHLPLQSGCDTTLRRMARRTTQAQFSALMQAARERIPDARITTDVIVGFPGETEAEFEISAAYIEVQGFDGLHVFRYSRRPGTAAARMRGHVSEAEKRARSERLIALSHEMERRSVERMLGRVFPVLWEQVAGANADGFVNVGYTPNYVRVTCVLPRPLTNLIVPARLERYEESKQQVHVTPLIEVVQTA